MNSVPLNESGSVTLNASGNGTVRMRPFGGGETWLPGAVSFKASSSTLEAQCRIYIGPAATDQYFIDGSLSGSTGDSTGRVAGYQVDSHGNYLWAVWTGGDVGATATVQVIGTEVTPASGSPFDLSSLPAPSSGCANPIIGGGGALVYPSVHSPNFNIANPAASPPMSWALLKSGLAYLFGVVLAGGTITGPDYIINTAGEFFYSGTPAAGNLVASRAATSGTDAFGNFYFPGDAVYVFSSGTYFALQTWQTGIILSTATAPGGPYTAIGASLGFSAAGVQVTGALTASSGLAVAGQLTANGGTAAAPTVISTDTWRTIGSFGAGFAAGAPAPQYALMPFGVGGAASVAVRGQVLATAATAVGATMFTLPYTFARQQDFVTPNNLSGAALGQRIVRVNATGAISCQAVGANTNFVILDGIIANTG